MANRAVELLLSKLRANETSKRNSTGRSPASGTAAKKNRSADLANIRTDHPCRSLGKQVGVTGNSRRREVSEIVSSGELGKQASESSSSSERLEFLDRKSTRLNSSH